MNYQETLKYLYESAPMFQQVGEKAYKPGLETSHLLDEHFGHPHQQFKTIHIAGTNGKGSCAHTIAAVLQAAGYRVGLYTSPHLVDFRERIRINGEMVSEDYVVRFVEEHRAFFEPLHPSFFELTTAMAFRYFADEKVDVAVIETGMGGRLDCTNIIHPQLCIITNIGLDHTQYLGDTPEKIAFEKAGIMKKGVSVIVGKVSEKVRKVLQAKAEEIGAPILFAEDGRKQDKKTDFICNYICRHGIELKGLYQEENIVPILASMVGLTVLGYKIDRNALKMGLTRVCELTGLQGRWQQLQDKPQVICDTGHNVDAFYYICRQLVHIQRKEKKDLHIVLGFSADKDIIGMLNLLPKQATYYFTQASSERALAIDKLKTLATVAELKGNTYPTVVEAVKAAKANCLPKDFIFIGGSSFIVADALANRDALDLH